VHYRLRGAAAGRPATLTERLRSAASAAGFDDVITIDIGGTSAGIALVSGGRQMIARPLGMSVEQAALGIHRVVNANMAEDIRFVSVKRGIDPRRFSLVPLGGGGPVHATARSKMQT
jgi:N-methylhydantoinase A/oxoprolinase/acetone carboxylase beta subunit